MKLNRPYRLFTLEYSDEFETFVRNCLDYISILLDYDEEQQDKFIHKQKIIVYTAINELMLESQRQSAQKINHIIYDKDIILTKENGINIQLPKNDIIEIILKVIEKDTPEIEAIQQKAKLYIDLQYPSYIFKTVKNEMELLCFPFDELIIGVKEEKIDVPSIVKLDRIFADNIDKIKSFDLMLRNDTILGYRINDQYWYFLSFEQLNKDFDLDTDNKWRLLQEYLTKDDEGSRNKRKIYKKAISKFKELSKNNHFIELLMKLDHWFYTNRDLEKDFIPLFENNHLYSNIKDKKFNNKIFVCPPVEDNTALGLYNQNNEGTSKNNLEYWLSNKSSSLSHFPIDNSYKPTKESYKTLKPEYSFYLMELFSEDYIGYVLHDLKQDGKIKNYLSNKKFLLDDKEIDFLVWSNNGQITKLEIKKTLSKQVIDSQKKKEEALIAKDELLLIDNYFLVGLKYTQEVLSSFHYFIEKDKFTDNYIEFELPLYNSNKKKLFCLAEYDYCRLKEKLGIALNEN